jgi:hypothetical protein
MVNLFIDFGRSFDYHRHLTKWLGVKLTRCTNVRGSIVEHYQTRSTEKKTQDRFFALSSFVGGFIRNISLIILLLWFGFAAAAAAVDTARSFLHHPGVRSFICALEADLSDLSPSGGDLTMHILPYSKDLAKLQKDETRARRTLAKELKRRKTNGGRI